MALKMDSESTSLATSSPSHSPRRQYYYVMSPSQPDPEKMSYNGSTPNRSPPHHPPSHYRLYQISSEIDHSRESATTPFSASLKRGSRPWNQIAGMRPLKDGDHEEDDYDDDRDSDRRLGVGCYFVFFILGFVILFSFFSLILWGASKSYKPQIYIKSVVFSSYNVHAGLDAQNVPTKMLSINSTVKMHFRNPATFFGVHVSSSPWEFYYSQLKVASGQMKEFYEPRKGGGFISVTVSGSQVPLYGGGSNLRSGPNEGPPAVVPLDLVFGIQAQANVLGKLVKSNFHRSVHCSVHLDESRLGKPILRLNKKCKYSDK